MGDGPESTAAPPATSSTGSEAAMDKNETIYQITMHAARNMLAKKLITKKEYRDFEKKMQQKYHPFWT